MPLFTSYTPLMKTVVLFFLSCWVGLAVYAQPGKIIRFSSAHAMFPDTARANGHSYNGKQYPASVHYSDSSVLIYVPDHFSPKGKINLVFWFHGWGNNIDTALKQYQVLEQFYASGRNAVFVFPQGPKNAPDSYGGKLEQPAVFQALVKEVTEKLRAARLIRSSKTFRLNDYSISLAGHSGAYRVISRIINQTPVEEVILFDAMYGGNDQYLQWLTIPENRFINIYTKEGGTFDNSHLIMKQLADFLSVPFLAITEEALTDRLLRSNTKLFIYSNKKHNEVITHNRNWERFLKSSGND